MLRTQFYEFFIARSLELLHKKSLDSYSVRYHNAYTILQEAIELIDDWNAFKIKSQETLLYCFDEVKSLIIDDTCLVYTSYEKDVLLKELENAYNSCKQKKRDYDYDWLQSLLITLEDSNSGYKEVLFSKIEEILFSSDDDIRDADAYNKEKELDGYISALYCQLVKESYPKYYLYRTVKDNLTAENLKDSFPDFKRKLLAKDMHNFCVIIKLYSKYASNLIGGKFCPKVPDQFRNLFGNNFLSSNENTLFYIDTNEALDISGATKTALRNLEGDLDFLSLRMSGLRINIPSNFGVILLDKNPIEKKTFTISTEENRFRIGEHNFRGLDDYQVILGSKNISEAIKARLVSAARHLRLGDLSKENGQRFINYWIALEFIFSGSQRDDSTFSRLKENIVNILSACYVKRNIEYLNYHIKERLGEEKIVKDKASLDDVSLNSQSPEVVYHINQLREYLNDGKNIKGYVERHKENLTRHISRIYRLRNQLIHEAAIKDDIGNITSNLRYYLVFVLSQMISFFGGVAMTPDEKRAVSMDTFFHAYKMRYESISPKSVTIEKLLEINVSTFLL